MNEFSATIAVIRRKPEQIFLKITVISRNQGDLKTKARRVYEKIDYYNYSNNCGV